MPGLRQAVQPNSAHVDAADALVVIREVWLVESRPNTAIDPITIPPNIKFSNTSQPIPTPTPPPNRAILPNLSQIASTTYNYVNEIPKYCWHICTMCENGCGTVSATTSLTGTGAPQFL